MRRYLEKHKRKFITLVSTTLFLMIMTVFDGRPEGLALLYIIAFPFLIAFFVFTWIFNQIRGIRQLKNESANAELMLLKSQVNPHFFFNTLNNLYGLTVEKSDKAPEVVLKISDMMRYTIYEGKKDKVKLEDELEYLQNFIELHRMRYHKKVDIHFHHQLMAEGYEVTPLLFIILLENAFKHGVKEEIGEAKLNILLQGTVDEIVFEIQNSKPVHLQKAKPVNKVAIGLANIRQQLDLLYPQAYDLSIQDNAATYTVCLKLQPNEV